MAVLNDHGPAAVGDEPSPKVQILHGTATVELNAVEVPDCCHKVDVLLIHLIRGFLLLGANAIIGVPPSAQAQAMSMSRHRGEIREGRPIHNRAAIAAVVDVAVRAGPAPLPVVIQAHVAIPEVTQRRGHTAHLAPPGDHAIHDALHAPLRNVLAEKVPRAPAHGRRSRQAVLETPDTAQQPHAQRQRARRPRGRHGGSQQPAPGGSQSGDAAEGESQRGAIPHWG
mmetsp:Transcript_67199/g.205797  ORF Transcript_67199/g.205797 Transcript_67199/m.205797 type:complete len:226 (+) Transcript_67199:274-951(+)